MAKGNSRSRRGLTVRLITNLWHWPSLGLCAGGGFLASGVKVRFFRWVIYRRAAATSKRLFQKPFWWPSGRDFLRSGARKSRPYDSPERLLKQSPSLHNGG